MELQELVGKLELPEVIEGVLWEKLRRSGRELSRMAEQPYRSASALPAVCWSYNMEEEAWQEIMRSSGRCTGLRWS